MHNYFDILDIEESFSIDQNLLEEKYFDAIGKYHPDRAPEDKKSSYSLMSSIANNAYEALKDDFSRASHILELHGININSDASAPKLPLDILEYILEMQEDLEIESKKQKTLEKAESQKEKILSELSKLLESKNFKEAAIIAMELKYLERIINQ